MNFVRVGCGAWVGFCLYIWLIWKVFLKKGLN